MFKNRNGKIIFKLALSDFRGNGKRNLFIIMAIMLSAFLFTTVFTVGIGAKDSLLTAMQIQKGSKADASISYMTEEQFQKLLQSDMAETAGMRRPVGYLSNIKNHNIEVNYMDETEQEFTFNKPKYGLPPLKENEIATTDAALEDLGVNAKVGETVLIEMEINGQLHSFEMVVSGWWEASNKTVSVMLVSDSFMTKNSEILKDSSDKNFAGYYYSDITFANKRDMRSQLNEWINSVGGEPENREAGNYLASSINEVTNPKTDLSTMIGIIIFGILFIVCGYLLIFNIYDISVSQKIRSFGLLKTIGMTQAQIGKMVRQQVVISAMIGIPIGTAAGFLIGKKIIPIIMGVFANDYNNIAGGVTFSLEIMLSAVLLTALTIVISIRRPIKIAAEVSPVSALKYHENSLGNKGNPKSAPKASIVNMAWTNISRNKRRFSFIILSLVLCIVFLNSAVSLAGSIDEDKFLKRQTKTDYVVASKNTFNNMKGFSYDEDGLDDSIVELLEQQTGGAEGGIIYKNTLDHLNISWDYGTKIDQDKVIQTEEGRKTAGDGSYYIPLSEDNRPTCNVYGLSEEVFRRLNFYGNERPDYEQLYEKMKSGNYLIAGLAEDDFGNPSDRGIQCAVGQEVTVYEDGKPIKTYTILAQILMNFIEFEVPNITTSSAKIGGDAPYLYMMEDEFKEIYKKPAILNYSFNADSKPEFDNLLEEYTDNADFNVAFYSTGLLLQSVDQMKSTISIFGIVIGIVFGLAGLLNFLNVMISGIINRRYEFAVMQSIGMTDKQLKKLIMTEGILYIGCASVAGILLSALINNTIISGVCKSIWYFTFHSQIILACLVAVFLIIVAFCVPGMLLRFYYKGNIVDKLKEII